MVYTFRDGVFDINENGCRIYQPFNATTQKPFESEEEALEWAKNAFTFLGEYVEIDFDTKKRTAMQPKTRGKSVPLESCIVKVRTINDDTVVVEEEIQLNDINRNFFASKLEETDEPEHYFDVEIIGGFCLFNKDKVQF